MSLTLIPTPIQDDHPLEPVAKELLLAECMKDDVLILVEEHKVARGRWLKWGLPREAIEKFILVNEHTQDKILPDLIKEMKANKRAYIMSDCGLPAFCDPGQKLVDACHRKGIKVTSTPFPNSIALALALSGFSHSRFLFSGWVPVKEPERTDWMRNELKHPETQIWMETPYRLQKLLSDLAGLRVKRDLFLAMDLGSSGEKLIRGPVEHLQKNLGAENKREFVLVVKEL